LQVNRRTFVVAAVAVTGALVLFLIGLSLSWAAYDISGCPPLFEDNPPCKTGWESEASWVVGAVAYTTMVGGPVLALVGVPVVAARRRRRGSK
jgi:hypothetical protein